MKNKWVLSSIAVLMMFGVLSCAQSPTVETKGDKKQISREPLIKAKRFQPVSLSIKGALFLGKVDAPVTLVEFTDYQCPFCKRHATITLPQLVKDYVDTGKLKYVLLDYPINQSHPNASKLSQATLCAGDQGKAWEMHDRIFSAEKSPEPDKLITDFKSIVLDETAFNVCMKSEKYAEKIKRSIADGNRLGIRFTPTFLVGKTNLNDTENLLATDMILGALPYSKYKKKIDKILDEN